MSRKKTSREPKERVRTARGRKNSSTRWLDRQLNDPYVHKAQQRGYRSRAAFKLEEIDEKANVLKPGLRVVDLGAAPGGWSQVAAEKGCDVIALDLLPMEALPGVHALQLDFMDEKAYEVLIDTVGEGADLVLSDMAPNTVGHKSTDHLRIMALVEAAYEFAGEVLKPGGGFVAKVFQGGTQTELLAQMKKDFTSVKHIKPPASRQDSSETYVVAMGYRSQ